MITIQQLEELEGRIIKALQLITDLRTENASLESENEGLKAENEEVRLSIEEKDREIQQIKRDMEQTSKELAALKDKEEVLEKKLLQLLGKLDGLQGGEPTVATTPPRAVERTQPERELRAAAPEPEMESMPELDEEPRVETVEVRRDAPRQADDDIIIIDDEAVPGDEDIAVETVSEDAGRRERGAGAGKGRAAQEDEDIILLDDDEDEIVIDDTSDDMIIIDENDAPRPARSQSGSGRGSAQQPARSSRDASDDDEFLIIEEDQR